MSMTFFDLLSGRFSLDRVELNPGRIVNYMRLVWQVRRERDRLASMSAKQLADLGIHPTVASREAERGLFDIPKSRLEKL